MNRASLVYIVMALCLVAGLWAILDFGSGLKAPPDLAGTWEIEPDAAAVVAPVTAPLGRSVQLEQSGRFLRLHFESGRVADLKMVADHVATGDGRTLHAIDFTGRGWALSAVGDPKEDLMRMELLGPVSLSFMARRTHRTYPDDEKEIRATTRPATRPAAAPLPVGPAVGAAPGPPTAPTPGPTTAVTTE
jgi:hypothetical protein